MFKSKKRAQSRAKVVIKNIIGVQCRAHSEQLKVKIEKEVEKDKKEIDFESELAIES